MPSAEDRKRLDEIERIYRDAGHLYAENVADVFEMIRTAWGQLAEMRVRGEKLHRRCQDAEAALPEWQEISAMTKQQATGRCFPALMRSAMTSMEDQLAEKDAEIYTERLMEAAQDWIESLEAENTDLQARAEKWYEATLLLEAEREVLRARVEELEAYIERITAMRSEP